MEVANRNIQQYRVVDIIGKIDRLKDSLALKSHILSLINEDAKFLALNLSQVNYLDSGALNVFIYSNNAIKKKDGEMCLIEPNEYVKDVLEVVGLSKLITIFPTEVDFEKHISA